MNEEFLKIIQDHCKKIPPYEIKNGKLHFKEGLYLNDCLELTALPEGLSIGRNLWLNGCVGLTALPEGLSVGGSLWLNGCTLYPFPDDLKVGGLIRGDYKIIPNSVRYICE